MPDTPEQFTCTHHPAFVCHTADEFLAHLRRDHPDYPAAGTPDQLPGAPGQNTGHGHVYPRPDGHRMRCGNTLICPLCQADQARKDAGAQAPDTTQYEVIPMVLDNGQPPANVPTVGTRIPVYGDADGVVLATMVVTEVNTNEDGSYVLTMVGEAPTA